MGIEGDIKHTFPSLRCLRHLEYERGERGDNHREKIKRRGGRRKGEKKRKTTLIEEKTGGWCEPPSRSPPRRTSLEQPSASPLALPVRASSSSHRRQTRYGLIISFFLDSCLCSFWSAVVPMLIFVLYVVSGLGGVWGRVLEGWRPPRLTALDLVGGFPSSGFVRAWNMCGWRLGNRISRDPRWWFGLVWWTFRLSTRLRFLMGFDRWSRVAGGAWGLTTLLDLYSRDCCFSRACGLELVSVCSV